MNDVELYDVIRKPVISEKSTLASEHAQIVFQVSLGATKPQIKAAVEKIFDVKVRAVNTLIRKGKKRRFKGRFGIQSDFKNAVVTLEPGYSIDITAPLV